MGVVQNDARPCRRPANASREHEYSVNTASVFALMLSRIIYAHPTLGRAPHQTATRTPGCVQHDSAPRYLGPLVAVADLPGRRALRSASKSRLVIPPIKLSTVGSREFPVAAAQVWNGLPEAVISSSSLQSFRRQLKTHLFQLSYQHLNL